MTAPGLLEIPGVFAVDDEVGTVRLYVEPDHDTLAVREAARPLVRRGLYLAIEPNFSARWHLRRRKAQAERQRIADARALLLGVLELHGRARGEREGERWPGEWRRCPPHAGDPCAFCGALRDDWLAQLYQHVAAGDCEAAGNMAIERFDDMLLEGRFAEADRLLAMIDLDRLDTFAIVAVLSATMAGHDHMPSRSAFVERAEEALRKLAPGRAAKLASGLRG